MTFSLISQYIHLESLTYGFLHKVDIKHEKESHTNDNISGLHIKKRTIRKKLFMRKERKTLQATFFPCVLNIFTFFSFSMCVCVIFPSSSEIRIWYMEQIFFYTIFLSMVRPFNGTRLSSSEKRYFCVLFMFFFLSFSGVKIKDMRKSKKDCFKSKRSFLCVCLVSSFFYASIQKIINISKAQAMHFRLRP